MFLDHLPRDNSDSPYRMGDHAHVRCACSAKPIAVHNSVLQLDQEQLAFVQVQELGTAVWIRTLENHYFPIFNYIQEDRGVLIGTVQGAFLVGWWQSRRQMNWANEQPTYRRT